VPTHQIRSEAVRSWSVVQNLLSFVKMTILILLTRTQKRTWEQPAHLIHSIFTRPEDYTSCHFARRVYAVDIAGLARQWVH
jgi:hypothetical protein